MAQDSGQFLRLSVIVIRFDPGVGSILDKVAKDIEDTANLYLYLYLRYIFGQPVSYQYLKILDEAKDKISFCKLAGISIV